MSARIDLALDSYGGDWGTWSGDVASVDTGESVNNFDPTVNGFGEMPINDYYTTTEPLDIGSIGKYGTVTTPAQEEEMLRAFQNFGGYEDRGAQKPVAIAQASGVNRVPQQAATGNSIGEWFNSLATAGRKVADLASGIATSASVANMRNPNNRGKPVAALGTTLRTGQQLQNNQLLIVGAGVLVLFFALRKA